VTDRDTSGLENTAALAANGVALVALAAGVLYQKRHAVAMDLRSGSAIQFATSALLLGVGAVLTEDMRIEWTGEFIIAMSWLVLAMSLGNSLVLLVLIRRGAAAKVSSLFYLVPAVTALMAFAWFDERLSLVALVGMVVATVGVAMATRN
jgi:drug/metabolite transporter (DMT)-like permease